MTLSLHTQYLDMTDYNTANLRFVFILRNQGRPLKRFLDLQDPNGTTSGPAPCLLVDKVNDEILA